MDDWLFRDLEITTTKICPVNCKPHCPQEKFRDAFGGPSNVLLSYEDFCQAIETVPKDVRIHFSGFSEPFLNTRALDMMEYARTRGHKLGLFTTLVGLTTEDVPRIKKIAPEKLVLHLPDNLGIAHISLNATYKEVLSSALSTLNVTGFSRMGDDFETNERAGNCENVAPRHVRGPITCYKLRYPNFVMLPNCDAVLCCMDWTLRHRIGNLLRESYEDLVASEEFRRVVRQRWALDGDALCRSCKWAAPLLSEQGVRAIARETLVKIRGRA